jgi:hypothetical protein
MTASVAKTLPQISIELAASLKIGFWIAYQKDLVVGQL